MRTILTLSFALPACSDGGGDAEETSIEAYACLHIAEGDILDVSLERSEAEEIEVGRNPYRVNLYPGSAGYISFDSAARDLALMLDFAGAIPAVWTGEQRTEIPPGQPNPNCDVDLVEVLYFSVPEGEHALEVGPAFQGAIWLMLGEPLTAP